jgi:hypothetical protein
MVGCTRLEPIAWTLRTYDQPTATYDDHSNAEMTVQAVLPGVWAISAHRGTHTRASLRALLQTLIDNQVNTVLCDREVTHTLPGATPRADGVGFEIDVQVLARRLRHTGSAT